MAKSLNELLPLKGGGWVGVNLGRGSGHKTPPHPSPFRGGSCVVDLHE